MASLTRTVSFPPEIWSHVLNNIPKSHQLQLLHVSSLFHDIVIKSLFASVKIYFIGGAKGLEMLHTKLPDWMEDIAIKLMCRSWELLNHIVQEPRFANVVKSITVIAFSDGLSLFERCKCFLFTYSLTICSHPPLHLDTFFSGCGQIVKGPSESPYLSLDWERSFFRRYRCEKPACKSKGSGSTIVNTFPFSLNLGITTYNKPFVQGAPNEFSRTSPIDYYFAPSYAILFSRR